jgi:hypothetical protein
MKVGILEIMPTGHYTLVDSITRIFASSIENHIFIFVIENKKNNLQTLNNLHKEQITFIPWNASTPLNLYFDKINNLNLDKLYIVTLEKYFKDFSKYLFNCQTNVFIHNIDEWFGNRLWYSLCQIFFKEVSLRGTLYNLKKNTYYSYFKRRIKKNILDSDSKFVVLNTVLKNELKKLIPENKIEIIPFSVYNSDLLSESSNSVLRICIPGMVSELRRDYYFVSNLLIKNLNKYRGKIEIVLLGFISNNEFGFRVIEEFQKLNEKGIKVTYFTEDYIPLDEYDFELSKCDLILGNIKVNIDKYSKYGKTKETGIPFTMIRAAKPGILPHNYTSIKELETSTLRFYDSNSLGRILIDLITDNMLLSKLKVEALNNSLKFDPARIYNELISK